MAKLMEVEMAFLDSLELTQTTANETNAGTDDDFILHIFDSSGQFDDIPLFDQGGNQREAGQTDSYGIDVSNSNFHPDDITLRLETQGEDRWLPASFEVVGILDNGESVTLVDRTWPNNSYFSTDLNEGQPEYTL